MILLVDIAPYRQGRELIGASGASCSGQCLNAAVLDKGKNTLSSPARHEPHVIQSDNYLAAEGGNRLRLVESGNNPTLAASGEEGTGEEAASLSTLAMVSRASARLFNVFSFVLMFG